MRAFARAIEWRVPRYLQSGTSTYIPEVREWLESSIRPAIEREVVRNDTRLIASSVSNGGGASVRAVEQDDEHLIDGLAVGEPNVNSKIQFKSVAKVPSSHSASRARVETLSEIVRNQGACSSVLRLLSLAVKNRFLDGRERDERSNFQLDGRI